MPVKLLLHQQLCELREDHGLSKRDMAAILGVHENSVGNWDRGAKSPSVYRAISYARALGRLLVVVRRGVVVCQAKDCLADLAKLRRNCGLTQQALDARMQMRVSNATEQRARNGASLQIATLEPYLAALGYEIRLVAPQALERVA